MIQPPVCIITLSYNRKDLIVALAASLNKYCGVTPFEWLIVDNGNDGTADLEFDLPPDCSYRIYGHDNSGNFASMNNSMVKYTDAQTLIFLNNDTEALTDFVTAMHERLSNHIGIVGAWLDYPDGRLQHGGILMTPEVSPGNISYSSMAALGLNPNVFHPSKWTEPTYFQAVTGACLAIRKHDFERMGGFHEEFAWCFEDVDLGLRMTYKMGKQCVVDPAAHLIHKESESGGDRNIVTNLMLLRGRWKQYVKFDEV